LAGGLIARIEAALTGAPVVEGVVLAGSRARGEATALSDWDFELLAPDLDAAVAALPRLVDPLVPLSRQWDRLSPFATYMLMLRGPVKVDFLFPSRPNPPAPPWEVSAATLAALDAHFWDWALWLASKRLAGRDALITEELGRMHEHLLAPMGAPAPATLEDAVRSYTARRGELERELGAQVPRTLEREVRPALEREPVSRPQMS
jgi:hypothetical protein